MSPGLFTPWPPGFNNSGQIVGSFDDTRGTHGFVDMDGSLTTFDVPGAVRITVVWGISDSGQIAGYFFDGFGVAHGFLDTSGNFTSIDVPGARDSEALGINNSGQIVGAFADAHGTHGFVNTGGSFTTIDVPGADITQALGINDSGQIVGFFQDATGHYGFIATPVSEPPIATPVSEPPSSLTLASCFVALFAIACRRKWRQSPAPAPQPLSP